MEEGGPESADPTGPDPDGGCQTAGPGGRSAWNPGNSGESSFSPALVQFILDLMLLSLFEMRLAHVWYIINLAKDFYRYVITVLTQV